ncbi:VOC family protein [Xanthomonas oryzae]|uniref:VOC family protein n=1 Tax=Xanthomonas oryzae TaxID=347 RepID=UPI0004146882|nr:VOC family protein [Xanthomonas oryzae]ALS95265.1 glyoxalase [Xanthomonas oryzae pv. oryzae]AUI90196.1 glyoxalase/bleomycin resistance/extradiol dioxygenase family protein [Xanthomonas oryzae pv. oryzae]AUI93872.1 glyoxalase/bleomycin resistance/extradiol dioxygenase family protein [Xanthomonas oryzae pv. oryzae]AUI97542.1 glyoxalase/bleomycin resistance/extradiol dioxygenase family protein [Xanthomonas oryzae pv. oryzae]AUJ01217.1 glyoxalase/bleomycin resistance/extradiol dioxygenase famil
MSPAIDHLAPQESAARERRIDYVEFASVDPDASRAFFETAFGWQFQAYGPDYLAFHDGRLDGGFYRAAAPAPAEGGPLVVLYADDLAPVLERVRVAGGEIVKPVFGFPGGSRFHFREPGGTTLAVWSERSVASND